MTTRYSKKPPKALLRVCASCEWIYQYSYTYECPCCGFGSYGAHYVYGNKAYSYAKTQKPWKDKQLQKALDKIGDNHLAGYCCWQGTHTRGHHHDTQCRNYVICF